jgi:hypothetical protein
MNILTQNMIKMVKPTQQKKDFVRREDPNKKLYGAVDDLEMLMKENNKLQKDKKKDQGNWLSGLLKGAALALAGGGLLGFLMTGKKEFLFSVLKGFKKAFFDIPKMMIEIFKIPKLFKAFSIIPKVFKEGFELFSKIGIKGVAKEGAKIGGKAFSKSVLKRIPFVGSLLGLFFGIQRFKKGDILGGMLEIASGITSIVPVAGIPIGIAIDTFLLFRDVKNVMTPVKDQPAPKPPTDLRKIPVIGSVIGMFDAIAKFVKDPIGAITDVAGVMENIIPGSGQIVLNAIGWVKSLMDKVPEPLKKGLGGAVSAVKNLASKGKSAVKGVISSVAGAPKKFMDKALNKALSVSQSALSSSEDFLYSSVNKDAPEANERQKGERGQGWYTYAPWHPVINGIDPKLWSNFQGMSKDYFDKTGKFIQINSGYRASDKDSLHGVGEAIDINSQNAGELEKAGLMNKWGFHRPLINYGSPKETWHIEPYPGNEYGPRNTNNFPVRQAVLKGKSDFGGDNLNLPQNQIISKNNYNEKQSLDLSESTIQALAKAMGGSLKNAFPNSKANQVSIDTNIRG